jgi:dCMP deaminase
VSNQDRGPAASLSQIEVKMPGISMPESVDNWDDYFMWIATAVQIKSKDTRCAVGAVIVSKDHVVLATGFNGMPRGVHDDEELLADAKEKIKVICHAEQNAILNAARMGVAVEGATIYVTKFPCLACCNAIVQAGIKRVYTHDKGYWDDDPLDETHVHKQRVIKETHLDVVAPFHQGYRPKQAIDFGKRRPPENVSGGSSAKGSASESKESAKS